jgi:hypothetical protein
MNDVLINRVFSAGLSLETALRLLDGYYGAAEKSSSSIPWMIVPLMRVCWLTCVMARPGPGVRE